MLGADQRVLAVVAAGKRAKRRAAQRAQRSTTGQIGDFLLTGIGIGRAAGNEDGGNRRDQEFGFHDGPSRQNSNCEV